MRRLAILPALLFVGLAAGGIVPDGTPIPQPGEYGAPHRTLTPAEQTRFLRGRTLFDKDFGVLAGIGPVMNGDSCRACHQDPVMGGSGGIDVQVQRPMLDDGTAPVETGELAQTRSAPGVPLENIPDTVVLVEERNAPTLLGLGLVSNISDAAILANEDPADDNGDGIAGRAHMLPDGSIGKMGWKAQVTDVEGFLRDATANEMGITVPPANPPSLFGIDTDTDAVQDPEMGQQDFDDLLFFMELLDFPPLLPLDVQSAQGEQLFDSLGCVKCHLPVLDGVELYSDLLLHNVQPPGFQGVTQGQASSGFYRTAPLRGLRDTAPYFHDGRSPTVDHAIRRHDSEALEIRQAYEALTQPERDALLAYLATR